MTPIELAEAIAASVRASLQIAIERGMTIEQFLADGGDRMAGNNAAQIISLHDA